MQSILNESEGVVTASHEGDDGQVHQSKGRRKNQHKPTVPDHILIPIIQDLYSMFVPASQMVDKILSQVDSSMYGISYRTILNRMKEYNIQTVRRQRHTVESLLSDIMEIKETYPDMGARYITRQLRLNKHIYATEDLVARAITVLEPEAVAQRKRNRYKRKQYYAAGVNENWTIDQHDKLLKYGFALHVCIEPYSGYVIWAKVWHTNKNPKVVGGWYLDAVRQLGAVPMFTQSDPGTENFGVANMQTLIRQSLDPSLTNTVQHKWMRNHQNIKPEIFWSGFRRHFVRTFENLFIEGGEHGRGIYDETVPLNVLIHRWLMIPWFQDYVDCYINLFNNTPRRASKDKILPQGYAPRAFFMYPQDTCNSLDFKLPLPSNADILDEVEELCAPRDDTVFQLVPPDFDQLAQQVFARIRAPKRIPKAKIWDVFINLRAEFERMAFAIPHEIPPIVGDNAFEHVGLLEGYQALFCPDPLNLPHELVECELSDAFRLLQFATDDSVDSEDGNVVNDARHIGTALSIEGPIIQHQGHVHNEITDIVETSAYLGSTDQEMSDLQGTLRVPITNIDEYYEG